MNILDFCDKKWRSRDCQRKGDKMQELSEKIGNHQYANINVSCMDCGKEFILEVERTGSEALLIKNGAVYKSRGEYEFKCAKCFKDNPNHGPKVDIYSRVVGFLRPVSDWNKGKRAEYSLRKVTALGDVGEKLLDRDRKPVETKGELWGEQ